MSYTRPTSTPTWATGVTAVLVEPPSTDKLAGWTPGERPPAQWLNWMQNLYGQWIQYLDQQAALVDPDTTLNTYITSEDASTDLGLYREVSGGVFPTAITWYTDGTKATLVKSKQYTRDADQQPVQIVYRYYVTGTLARTITDQVTYSNAAETRRTRTIA